MKFRIKLSPAGPFNYSLQKKVFLFWTHVRFYRTKEEAETDLKKLHE